MKVKHMKKRSVAYLLTLVIIVSIVGTVTYYVRANTYAMPAEVLLESMLNGDRHWVIETIVDDNRTNNPYALNGSEPSMMAKALNQYENKNDPDYNALFSLLVDVLAKYYYTGLWATDLGDNELTAWAEEHPVEMALIFGTGGSAALILLVGQLKNLAEMEQFDNIMFSVFQDTYTSSWGESINEQEIALQQLNEISATFSNLKDLTGYWKNLYGAESDTAEAKGVWQFMEKVAIPMYQSGEDFLKAFNNLTGGEQAAVLAALGIASVQCSYNWLISESGNYNNETVKKDVKKYIIGKDESKLLKLVGSGFEWSSTLISQYSFLHSLCKQMETFQGTVTRMADQASVDGQKNMSRVLNNYAGMMETALDNEKLQLVTILRTLSSMAGVSKNSKISTIYDKTVKLAKDCGYENIAFSSISSVFDVGMTVVDECTGLQETCIKTYELIYLRDIITEAKKVYEQDLLTYTGERTEENANKVLMDLLMIQRLRLKGETIAYKMTKGQLNSWIGKLLTGYNSGSWAANIFDDTELAKAWTGRYQRSVDALIGATICPIASESFQVAQGEELFIVYDSEKNTYRARYTTNGKDTTLYEMQYRVMNGIKVNGGSVTITEVSVPFIVATGTSFIGVDPTARIGEITQSGTCTLELYNGQSTGNYTLELPYTLDLQNANVKLNGNTIDTSILTLMDGVLLEGGNLVADEVVMNGATVTGGSITCSGNVSKIGSESNSISSLILNGTEGQSVSGILNVGNLTLNNVDDRAIRLDGTVNVSGVLSDPDNRVLSGLVLNSTAQIAGNRVASDVILDGTNIPKEIEFENGVMVRNNASFAGGSIGGFLQAQDAEIHNTKNSLTLKKGVIFDNAIIDTSMPMDIYEMAVMNNTVFQGQGDINLYASDVTGTKNTFETLNICGRIKQQLDFGAAVEKLSIANESIRGVDFSKTIEITEQLSLKKQKITGGENLVATAQAAIDVDKTKTNLTIKDWDGTWNGSLIGNIICLGKNELSDVVNINGETIQQEGTLHIIEGKLETVNFTQNSESQLDIAKSGSWEASGDSYLSGSILNEGMMTSTGELAFSGEYVGNGTLALQGSNAQRVSGNLAVNKLLIEHSGYQKTTFDGTVKVAEELIAKGQRINGGSGVTACGTAVVEIDGSQGDLTLEDWTGTWNGSLSGNIYLSGNTIFTDEVVVDGIVQDTGSLQLMGAKVETNALQRKSTDALLIDEESSLSVSGDTYIASSVENNGVFKITGSLDLDSNFIGNGTLVTLGYMGQTIDGTDINVGTYSNQNNSWQGVQLNAQIYASETYINEGHIRGKTPILSKGYDYAGSTVLETLTVEDTFVTNGNLTINNDLMIQEGMEFKVKGDLTVNGSFTAATDSIITVEGNVISKSNAFHIGEGAQMTIYGNYIGTNTPIVNDGTWAIWQDCKLSGGTLSGTGKMVLYGDLENTGTVSGLESLEIRGKVPQKISGNAIHANQLIIENNAKSGVNLSLTIYYKEKCMVGENCSVNEENIMKEAE